MAKYFGDAEFDIPCGSCGKKTKQKVRTLEMDPQLTCPYCGIVTKIDASHFRQEMRKADQALDDFKRKFGK